MRNYRAVVIDGRKIIRRGVMLIIITIFVVMAVVGLLKSGTDLMLGENIIGESIPIFSAVPETEQETEGILKAFTRKLLTFVFTFDPYEPTTILEDEVPLMQVVRKGYLSMKVQNDAVAAYNPENADTGSGKPDPDMPEEGQYPIKAIDSSQSKALGKSNAKILIRNETNYSIDIAEMLDAKLDFNMSGDGPKILILHTHATECYTEQGVTVYSPDKSDRTLDSTKSVIAVGERMKRIFETKGIGVIHDTTLHDHPNFNGSYANSLKTAEMYKAKYPSIRLVLDIHRDAYVYDDGSKAKFVTKIDGTDTAQLMFVVGTNAGGLDHPRWRENMKLAIKLQQHISKSYPALMRGVNLRKERFNGHVTTGSLIIEVGSSGNTLDEALHGAECAAIRIADFLNNI